MVTTHDPADGVKVLVPSGMLGSGFTPESLQRGIELGAAIIAVDGGSTDSGPYYLGTGRPKVPADAIRRDLDLLIRAAAEAEIPLVVGSCATAGTDAGVDLVAGIAEEVLAAAGLDRTVARIYCEQRAEDLVARLEAGRVKALAPSAPLDAATLERCEHIVGMSGHEPFVEALRAGADIVLAGRSSDAAVVAAGALMLGAPAGPTWHAAKIAECGGQCTTNPRSGAGVLFTVDADGFTIESLDAETVCTPRSVAAHMLYETVNPHAMREPPGTLVASDAVYSQLDDRRVRVEGSRFDDADQYTNKLEGAARTGYETLSLTGVRDPRILADVDGWAAGLLAELRRRVQVALGLGAGDYEVALRLYGHDAILGPLEPDDGPPREVGAILVVHAPDQATATAVAKTANPLMLHMPLAGMEELPSFAFLTSPAEIERGAAYEFVLNHVVEVDHPTELFRIEMEATTRV
ncbi:acyclic terpene utilization AtuA family protein [Patulibacter sp. S7RM1-6]